jgi:hypothetical protein
MFYGAALPLNLLPHVHGIRLLRADRVEILSCDVPAQADGDPAGDAPVVIENAATPIQLVVG